MNNIDGWSDWLDEERADKAGEYYLHRNYYNNITRQVIYIPYPNPKRSLKKKSQDADTVPVYIDQTIPIAIGILAFYAAGYGRLPSLRRLLEWGKDFKATDFYRYYFENQINREYKVNDKLPNPLNKVDVLRKFVPFHLEKEKLKFRQSSKYFDEVIDEKDRDNKLQLKDYVEGYFNWVALLAMDKGTPTKEILGTPNTILEEVCVSHEAYINIVKWFIEHGFVDGQTLIWKDTGRGNASILVNYIRDLRRKGYVKKKLLSPLIHSIVQHDFSFEMGIDIVKKAIKGNDPYNLPVIPYFKAEKNIPPQG